MEDLDSREAVGEVAGLKVEGLDIIYPIIGRQEQGEISKLPSRIDALHTALVLCLEKG